MTSTCAIYCLNFNNDVRKASMIERFHKIDLSAVLHPGVPISDPRIAGRHLIPHTEKCWSCMYGHLDMIREFVDNDSRQYGIFCEDDIMIDANFKPRLEHILNDFDSMNIDTMLLGYLITYPLVGESNGSFAKYSQSIYVDIDSAKTTTFRYYDYGDIWGTQMYLLSRNQARKIIDKYANGYADHFLQNSASVFPPFSADWSITKEGKRCIVYPMLAIEDGLTNYNAEDAGQHEFHMSAHSSHIYASNYI
jgi:GR25 family glycosyltransferase involved in LPS biosynthesis